MNAYYSVLDLPEDATLEQIKTQFRRMVRIFHPDRFSEPDDRQFAESKMRDLNVAYNALLQQAKLKQKFKDIRSRASRKSKSARQGNVDSVKEAASDSVVNIDTPFLENGQLMSVGLLCAAMLIDLFILLSLIIPWA